MKTTRVRIWHTVAVSLLATSSCPPALGQSCALTPSNLDFGEIDPLASNSFQANASFAITCSGFALHAGVRACIRLGTGSAGSGYAPRTLANGAETMAYGLYADPAYASIVGGRGDPYAPLQIDVPLVHGAGSANVRLYGRLAPKQTRAPAGLYTSNFTGAQTAFDYAAYLAAPSATCATLMQPGTPFGFSVSATARNQCTINATDIDFGATGLLRHALDAHGTVTVACTRAASYSITLDAGQSAGANVADRRMTHTGGNAQVHYQLYTDGHHAQPWGDGSNGTTAASGIGSGGAQQFTIHARIPMQPTPSAGRYADTVTATIHY